MSLINQMLKDLDNRRAAEADRRLPNEVRPLPAVRRQARWPIAIGVALVVVAGIAVWIGDGGALFRPAPLATMSAPIIAAAPAVAVAVPAAITPPALSPPPAAMVGLPSVATADPLPAEVAPLLPQPPTVVASDGGRPKEPVLRLADTVRRPVAPVATPPVPAAPATVAVTAEIPAPASIDKQTRLPSQRERSDAAYRTATGLINQGRTETAAESLRTILHEDPAHHAARQLLARLLVDARAYDELRDVLSAGLERSPQQASWALLLSRLLVDKGEPEAALTVLQTPALVALGNADVPGAAGAILHRLGRHAEAESRYAEAARIDPAQGRWWLGLALAIEAQGRGRDSREALLRARAAGNLAADLQAFVDQKLK